MEEIEKQIQLSEHIRKSGGLDVEARNKNSYKFDVNFHGLFVRGEISKLIARVGILPVIDSHFSQTPIEGCCCNSSEPLHSLSLVKNEGVLIGIRDAAGKVSILGSLKANKEGVGLGEKNTLITWVNTSEIPAGTICAINEPRKIFARAINKITNKRDNKSWPAIIILDNLSGVFPLRLIFPLENQTERATSFYQSLHLKRQELLATQNIGYSFEVQGEGLKKTDSVLIS